MGVVTELAGPAALVVLDWPEKRNALGPDEANEVAAALRAAAGQPRRPGHRADRERRVLRRR